MAAPPDDPLQHRPSARLAPYIRSITGYRLDGMDGVHHGLPSTDLTFILSLGRPLVVGWTDNRSDSREFQAMVSGLHTGPAFIFPTPDHAGIQLGLTPLGVRALFGMPAAELHAALVPLQDLWRALAADLVDRLHGCSGWADRFAVLECELERLLAPDVPSIRTELRWAWHQLVVGGAVQTVRLADDIGWSRGYFARQFAAEFGLKPKETARIVRFGRAKAALGRGDALAEVAFGCGYADQAHLTREWRRLAGCTPTAWQAEMAAFVHDGADSVRPNH